MDKSVRMLISLSLSLSLFHSLSLGTPRNRVNKCLNKDVRLMTRSFRVHAFLAKHFRYHATRLYIVNLFRGWKFKMSKILNFRNSDFKTCRMPTKIENLKLKWLIRKLIKEAIIISLIQYFEAGFIWEVSLKILNSGFILKTFTHALFMLNSTEHEASTAHKN